MEREISECERVKRSVQSTLESNRTFEMAELRDKERDVSGYQFRLANGKYEGYLVRRPAEIKRIAGRETYVHTTQVGFRVR